MEQGIGFWNLLKTTKIVIPAVQRDYAQGRTEEMSVRRRFLTELKDAVAAEGGRLVLDFVYGSVERGDTLMPLDGQQRLTTLWLVHWYVALMAGCLNGEATRLLVRFSYETRVSSKEFCRKMCEKPIVIREGVSIAETIRRQTWYCASYDCDPTVRAMLNTLAGTEPDGSDGVAGMFANLKAGDFVRIWERLTSDAACPIVFHYKDLRDKDLPLSDDLYVKMNARGKQLSGFENFKADLFSYPDRIREGEHLIDFNTAAAMDNAWTDVFWLNRLEDSAEIDDIYLDMFRRYLLNWFIAESVETGHLAPLTVAKTKTNELYRHVYKRDADAAQSRHRVRYEGIDRFGVVLDAGAMTDMVRLMDRFAAFVKENGLASVEEMIAPAWGAEEGFSFVPRYVEAAETKEKIASLLTMKGRVAFYAASRYFEQNERPDERTLRRWMRFVWNIVENGSLETEDAMISAIRFFREVSSEHTADIGDWLISEGSADVRFATRQMTEERLKAKLESDDSKTWTARLVRAEQTAFFRGHVGFLLKDGSAEAFDIRLAKAERYFDRNGVKPEWAPRLTAALVRSMVAWNQFYQVKFCDSSAKSWKESVILKEAHADFVDRLLTCDSPEDIAYVPFPEPAYEAVKRKFLEAKVLDQPGVVGSGKTWRMRFQYPTAFLGFYQERQQSGFYVFDYADGTVICQRNRLLLEDVPPLGKDNCLLTYETVRIVSKGDEQRPHLAGAAALARTWDVRFQLHDREWLWSRYRDGNFAIANYIYLMDGETRLRRPLPEDGAVPTDECARYYAIAGNKKYTSETFRAELDRVAADYDVRRH